MKSSPKATRKSIITLPNKHLRQKSKKVLEIDEKTKKIIRDMQDATLDWEDHRKHEFGVALAAVQIDKLHRIVIVRDDLEHKDNRSFKVFINPKISAFSGEPELDYEGCLSIKDVYGKVFRYPQVTVQAQDENGNKFELEADGFLARVFQHVIDHTNGKLFIDHIKDKDLFYVIKDDGKLEKQDYEAIKNSEVLWG